MDSYPRTLILAVAMTACLNGCALTTGTGNGNDDPNGDAMSIIGNWVAQEPYNEFSRPGVLTVSNEEMLWEWEDGSGHVSSEIVQFDNETRTAIGRVTEHSTAPSQIGLFTKIVWTFLDADSMDMDVYGLQATEADALSDTIVAFGTWHYVSDVP